MASAHAGASPAVDVDRLERAMQTERTYFELGARLEELTGAVLAWTPHFVGAAAAAVVHRVEPEMISSHGLDWLVAAERRLAEHGIGLARIYLERRDPVVDGLMAGHGYACREELIFCGDLPPPPSVLQFRPVSIERDWARKLAFHEEVPESPDGHCNEAAAITGLERHKCAYGMEAFTGEIDGTIAGLAGALWGDGLIRIKNLLVHPAFRRRSVATALVCHIAERGRSRGVDEQCLVALKGGTGEMLYRALGMTVAGSVFEWSKRLGGR